MPLSTSSIARKNRVLIILNDIFRRSCSYLLLSFLLFAATANARPFAVSAEISISSGDWFPLPAEDMKAAAADTALSELTKGGLFSISPESSSKEKIQNKLRLEISLIGPAETAKLTISVDLKGQATYISTASISVHDMDYQGIYNAFEHIGRVAAQRLNDKTEALYLVPAGVAVTEKEPIKKSAPDPETVPNDKALQAVYDDAQKLKRQYQYQKARVLFEQVAAATGAGSERLSALAIDELKYGLTVFEAKQSMVAMGGGDAKTIAKSIRHAENLFRQILAENNDDLLRTQEAQMALDNLSVSSNALKNVLRAQALATASQLRVMMQEHTMMMGNCPDKKEMSRQVSSLHTEVIINSVRRQGEETRYIFTENNTGSPFAISCANQRITIIN